MDTSAGGHLGNASSGGSASGGAGASAALRILALLQVSSSAHVLCCLKLYEHNGVLSDRSRSAFVSLLQYSGVLRVCV